MAGEIIFIIHNTFITIVCFFFSFAWTIAQCQNCMSHMGWKFTARQKDMVPQKFWGLCRASLVPGLSNPDDIDAGDWLPVM